MLIQTSLDAGFGTHGITPFHNILKYENRPSIFSKLIKTNIFQKQNIFIGLIFKFHFLHNYINMFFLSVELFESLLFCGRGRPIFSHLLYFCSDFFGQRRFESRARTKINKTTCGKTEVYLQYGFTKGVFYQFSLVADERRTNTFIFLYL